MDPSAHFYHSELRSDNRFDRGWQKLSIDRVTSCSFDPSGRLCAIYFNNSSIELWDFTSVPVPMTMLLLPKHLCGRYDGICHSMTWSVDGTKISGVFGQKAVCRRRAGTSSAAEFDSFQAPAYHLVTWNIATRVIIHKYRFPFAVSAITQLPVPHLQDYYIVSTTFGNQLLLFNANTGRVQSLIVSPHDGLPHTVAVAEESIVLQNLAHSNANVDSTVVVMDADIFAMLDTWASSSGVSNVSSADTALSSTFLCAADQQEQQTQLYFVGHRTENRATADVLYSIRVTNVDDTPYFEVTSSVALTLPCRVTHLAVDPDNQQLTVTAENGTILAYSLLHDALVPVIEHRLSDRSLVELLNSHSAADSLRSQHKGHSAQRSGGAHGEQKKSVITLPGSTVFKTFGASFYQYDASQYADDTRFTNSLKPHTLVYPNHSASNSNVTATRPISRIASATCITNCANECDASHHRTGLMYAVQGYIRGAGTAKDSTSDFLLLWDIDHTHSSANGGSVRDNGAPQGDSAQEAGLTRLSADRVKVIDLPKGGVQQMYISTAQSRYSHSVFPPSSRPAEVDANVASVSTGKSRADWRSARQAPRQTVLCLDQQGRLWFLQTSYRTDFPGPMYPVGYTLITKVIKYTETESELDIVPGMAGAAGGGSAAQLSSQVASNCAVISAMHSALNSAKVSREDLVGLDIDGDEPSAKRTRTGGSVRSAPVNIERLVLGRDRNAASSASKSSIACLPFTFVQDYYIAPVSSASANSGVTAAAVLAAHGSPGRSPRVTASALSTTPGAFSPPRSGSVQPQASAEAEELPNPDNMNSGETETAAEEVSWSFDEVVPPPVRVLNGDFDAKLGRQQHNADAVLQVMREPARLSEKLKQMQDEAVEAAVRAEETKERARLRNAVKKQEKDEAKKAHEERLLRESRMYNAAMNAQAAVQAAEATGGFPLGDSASLTALAGAVYHGNGGASAASSSSGQSTHANGHGHGHGHGHSQGSRQSSMPPPASQLAGPSNRAPRVHSYMPGAPVVQTKVTMPHNYLSMAANPSPPGVTGPAGVSFLSPADVLAPRVGSGYAPSPAHRGSAGVSTPTQHAAGSSSAVRSSAIAVPSMPPLASQRSQVPLQALQQVLQRAPPNAELSPAQQMKLYNFLMNGAPPPATDGSNHT